MMAEDTLIPLATPTRFLMENGEWNLTPSLTNEMNPFDYQFQKPKTLSPPTQHTSPSPPLSLSQSPTSSSDSFYSSETFTEYNKPQQVFTEPVQAINNNFMQPQPAPSKPKKSTNTSGRKRRIVFEGEDAEERRKKFLERNRIAAYKCRQRKKCWMQDLEQKAEIQNTQNEELRALVTQLKEESMYLRNLLLTHGNCDCEAVQAYIRKTSAEISSNTPTMTNTPPLTMRRTSTSLSSFSTGLTPYINSRKSIAEEPSDYFASSHPRS